MMVEAIGGYPTWRAHCYRLSRAVMNGAVEADLIGSSPCRKRGAGTVKRQVDIEPATPDELAVITAHMPERLRLAVTLSAWCALRFGELAELRRSDIDLGNGVVKIRRAMVRIDGKTIVGQPKSRRTPDPATDGTTARRSADLLQPRQSVQAAQRARAPRRRSRHASPLLKPIGDRRCRR